MSLIGALITLFLTQAMAAEQPESSSAVTIAVFARSAPESIDRDELIDIFEEYTAKRKLLENEQSQILKDLKKQYGRKRKTWPSEAFEKLGEFDMNLNRLAHEYHFKWNELEGLEGSTGFMRKYLLSGKGLELGKLGSGLELVEDSADADLVIEVLGRFKQPDDNLTLCIKVSTGENIDPTKFAGNDFEWPEIGSQNHAILHDFTTDEPYWDLHVTETLNHDMWISLEAGTFTRTTYWRELSSVVVYFLDLFVIEHKEALLSARRP